MKRGFFSGGGFQALFTEAGLSKQIRFSLNVVLAANICNKLFTIVTTGTALTGYAGELQADSTMYGLLTAIPFLATLLQIPAAIHVAKTGKRKRLMMKYSLISRVLWLLVGLVPLIVPFESAQLRLWTVLFLVCLAASSGCYYTLCFNSWIADLVPISIRGRWFGLRDRIILIVNLVFSLLVARLLDQIDGLSGYCVVFIIAAVIGIIDVISYRFVEESTAKQATQPDFRVALRSIGRDKYFKRLILFWTVWLFCSYLSSPYVTYYALYTMKLSFMDVTLYGTLLGGFTSMCVIARWGGMMDRRGNRRTMLVSGVGTALSTLMLLFAVPGEKFAFILYNFFGAIFWEVPYLTANNMLLCESPDDNRISYIAIFSGVTSVFGSFAGTLFGGSFLKVIPALIGGDALSVLGHPFDQYQILFFLSALVRLLVVLLLVPRLRDDHPDKGAKCECTVIP